jgi:hypothetical protein
MAGGQKKRPFPERHRCVRCPSLIYFAYLVKKFNLKIRPHSGPGASRQKSGLVSWFRKVFGGAGILPVWVHRLKTCATKV